MTAGLLRSLAVALVAVALPALAQIVPEPAGYRLDNYRAPTPQTLAGASVLSTAEALALHKAGGAAFVDVMPQPPRPANLPAGTLWRDPPHESIPGALWLPNVGFGALAPETEAYFAAGLSRATAGDRAKPVVVFCLRDCWMSWNAAKRALALGYADVRWYPDGADGFSDIGIPLVRVEREP